jgi:hypothetical protein
MKFFSPFLQTRALAGMKFLKPAMMALALLYY